MFHSGNVLAQLSKQEITMADKEFGLEKNSARFELNENALFGLDEIARIYELSSRESALKFAIGAAQVLGYRKESGWETSVTKDGETRILDFLPSDVPKAPGGGPVRDQRSPAPQVA
jgi:hypothetical protein